MSENGPETMPKPTDKLKELSLCNTFMFYNPYIFATFNISNFDQPELKTLKWWISRLMLFLNILKSV